MGLDILLSTELPCFGECDEPRFELGPKDSFQQAKVVVVDICHEREEFVCEV